MNIDRGWPDEEHLWGKSGKNLVLCLDGTNDEIGVTRPTNPAKVFEMLDLDNPSAQVAYYDPGVGTLPSPTAVSALGRFASRCGELAFGWGIKAKLTQAYTWLMNTYRPGDRVYLFGFSRGAYTARACGHAWSTWPAPLRLPQPGELRHQRIHPQGQLRFRLEQFARVCRLSLLGYKVATHEPGLALLSRRQRAGSFNTNRIYGHMGHCRSNWARHRRKP